MTTPRPARGNTRHEDEMRDYRPTCPDCGVAMRQGNVWPHDYYYCPLCGEFDDDEFAEEREMDAADHAAELREYWDEAHDTRHDAAVTP